jgi:hypothetical protein
LDDEELGELQRLLHKAMLRKEAPAGCVLVVQWFSEIFNCGTNVYPDNSLSNYTTRSEIIAFQNVRLENLNATICGTSS